MKVKLTEIKNHKFKGYKLYDVQVTCAGDMPMSGYLTVPEGAKPKSLPAYVTYQGAGVSSSWTVVARGAIAMNINAHGIPNGNPREYYVNLSRTSLKGYWHRNMNDREKIYFNGMYLRVMRSLDFMKSRTEWDGKNLIATGGSQGGLQTVWAAALVDGLSVAQPSVPWCGDIGGTQAKRMRSEFFPKYSPGLDYFDIVNHAKRIPASCYVKVVRAGLGDYVCPPSGVQIFYNNVKGPKEIHWFQNSGHGGPFLPKMQKYHVYSKK
jgi:cephalosporin-C deacetylase-like acetyl esterase